MARKVMIMLIDHVRTASVHLTVLYGETALKKKIEGVHGRIPLLRLSLNEPFVEGRFNLFLGHSGRFVVVLLEREARFTFLWL